MNPDVEDSPSVGRFVHLDVLTAHSPWCSPSTPEQNVRALGRQYRLGPNADSQPRPALAIADYGLHSAVKTAVACQRAGIEHIVGLRVPVVPERGKRTFFVIHPNASVELMFQSAQACDPDSRRGPVLVAIVQVVLQPDALS
jgi:DNA polymerase III alpha subunit